GEPAGREGAATARIKGALEPAQRRRLPCPRRSGGAPRRSIGVRVTGGKSALRLVDLAPRTVDPERCAGATKGSDDQGSAQTGGQGQRGGNAQQCDGEPDQWIVHDDKPLCCIWDD